MQKICIDLVGAHYVRPRANAVRPCGHCVTVYVSAKSKFSVRSAEMRRICTGLGRGRRLSTPRPTQIYTLFYALRAVEAPAPTGIMQTVHLPAKSKFTVRSGRTQSVYTNLGSPANGFGLRNSNRYSGQSGGLSLQGFRKPLTPR